MLIEGKSEESKKDEHKPAATNGRRQSTSNKQNAYK